MLIPDDLKKHKSWLCYDPEDKSPQAPWIKTGKIDGTNKNNHTDFDTALRYARKNEMGIGFALNKENGITGIDFDGCVNGDKVNSDVVEWVDKFNSYTEFSPSKKGIHILVRGEIPSAIRKHSKGIEVYSEGRYFTVTGECFPKLPFKIEERQNVLDELYKVHGNNKSWFKEAMDRRPELTSASPIYKLTYQDIFPGIIEGQNIAHPIHGSKEKNMNFRIDDGLGRCYRCEVSLTPHQMLAVKAGILECEDAGDGWGNSGVLSKLTYDNELQKRVWEFAIKEKLISQHDKAPAKISTLQPPKIDDIFIHKYDKDGNITSTKILTGVLGNYISHQFIFKTLTDTEEVFVYSEGVYVPAETLIKSECQIIVGEKLIKTNHVNEAIDFIRRKTYEDRDSFDMDDKLINLKNGLYDVENNKLIPHTPDYLSFIQMPIEYDPMAKCPLWNKYLGNTLALDEDRMILQEVAGWVFMGGYNIQKAVLLEGGGGNGKSVYLDTITEMIGADNVSSVSWQDLGDDKYAKAQLYGKMANIHTDLSKTAITDTSSFKALTGGDKIWSDVKHSIKGINFYNRAKLIYAANQIPRSKDITDAFFDRLILINFPYKIRGTEGEDKNLKKKLLKELPGIFNWALIGLDRLLENEEFSTSKTTDDFKSIYQKKSDSVFAFFGDLIRKGTSHDKETKEDVYQKYVAYCRRFLYIEPVNKQVFGSAFGKQAGYIGSGQRYIDVDRYEKPVRVSCWTNILIKDLPGKQDTIPWTSEGIVSEKTEPKINEKTIHTIPKTPLHACKKSLSLGNIKKEGKNTSKKIISDKNREKGIVSIDIDDEEGRLKFLFSQIYARQKAMKNEPVYKSEISDEYQLKGWPEAMLEHDLQLLLDDKKIQKELDGGFRICDIDKIMKGVKKSQRDRLTHVLDIIRELEKEFNAPVMKSEIVERALKEGISEREVQSSIDRLKQDGKIYDPNRNERYKIV